MKLLFGYVLATVIWLSVVPLHTADDTVDDIFKKNRYGGVLIAIHPSVKEDPDIIQGITNYFREASIVLLRATKRVYFSDIKILIPTTWTDTVPSANISSTDRYEHAHVVVDQPSASLGDAPFVKQTKGCGEMGEFIHLTPKFLSDRNYVQTFFGDPGLVLAHEWGHYRWGLFDEHPLPGQPAFYNGADGEIKPVVCGGGVEGEPLVLTGNGTSRPCKLDRMTSLYEEACQFVPSFEQPVAKASLMGYQFIKQLSNLCNSNTSDPGMYHDSSAPTKHNIMCDGRSAWDVASQSPEFTSGLPSYGDATVEKLVRHHEQGKFPSVALVRHPPPLRLALVLDISGSMMASDRLWRVRQATTRFLFTQVTMGTSLGLVSFNSHAEILINMTQLNSLEDQEKVYEGLPRKGQGSTCIGCGLKKAVQLLKAGGGSVAGSHIFIIVDGRATGKETIDQVAPEIKRLGIVVDTMLISRDADRNLRTLAQETGGMVFEWAGQQGSSIKPLQDAFASMASGTQSNEDNPSIQVADTQLEVPRRGLANCSVVLDASASNDTEFSFSYSQGFVNDSLEVWLETPSGERVGGDRVVVRRYKDVRFITFVLQGVAEPGVWVVWLKNGEYRPQSVDLQVNAKPASARERAIDVSATISASNLSFADVTEKGKMLVVYASVNKGPDPVLGASVTAHVQLLDDDGKPLDTTSQRLLDNGAGPDVTKNDGMYSGYFLRFTGDGRYYVRVTVESAGGTRVPVSVSLSPASLSAAYPQPISRGPANFSDVENLNRVAPAGSFDAHQFPDKPVNMSRYFPPSRVIDLQVEQVSFKNRTVSLTYTAVGEDFVQAGPVAAYQLRLCETADQARHHFNTCRLVNASDIADGGIDRPAAPGDRERVTVRLPADKANGTSTFAVVAFDAFDNAGAVSNAVAAAVRYVEEEVIAIAPTPAGDDPKMTPMVVSVMVSGFALTFIIMGLIAVARRRSLRKAQQRQAEVNEEVGTPVGIHRRDPDLHRERVLGAVFSGSSRDDAPRLHRDESSNLRWLEGLGLGVPPPPPAPLSYSSRSQSHSAPSLYASADSSTFFSSHDVNHDPLGSRPVSSSASAPNSLATLGVARDSPRSSQTADTPNGFFESGSTASPGDTSLHEPSAPAFLSPSMRARQMGHLLEWVQGSGPPTLASPSVSPPHLPDFSSTSAHSEPALIHLPSHSGDVQQVGVYQFSRRRPRLPSALLKLSSPRSSSPSSPRCPNDHILMNPVFDPEASGCHSAV